MILELSEVFQRDLRALGADERADLFEALLVLPGAVGAPHQHVGLGLRKLHPAGIWEGRAGLALRFVFRLERNTAVLLRVGTHDEIRRFLRRL